MKKYLLAALAVSAFLILCLSGCTNESASGDSSSQTEENSAPAAAIGDTVTIDDTFEFHLEYVNITKEPELYYPAEKGKVYVDFCLSCKNIGSEETSIHEIISGTLVYSGTYKYAGSLMEEEGDDRFLSKTYYDSWLDPQGTAYLHYLFTAPEEVLSSDRMLEINTAICDSDYRILVREGETGPTSDGENSKTSGKTSETITEGETITTENLEFCVDFCEITNDVIPPRPGIAYNHFAAEAGETYVNFCVSYKNLSPQAVGAKKALSVKLTIDGEQYQGAAMAEINGRSMFEAASSINLLPLSTEYIHYLFPISEEIAAGGKSIEITIKADGISYTYHCK